MTEPPRAVAFDVIGTLFSLEGLRPRLAACGLPDGALETWFAASLRDLFALAVTGRTAAMTAVLADNLRQLLARNGLRQDGPLVDAVLDGMSELECDAEAPEALALLRSNGMTCAALSNGGQAATQSLLSRAGLDRHIAHVLSIDAVGLPKPRAEVYQAMTARLRLAPASVLMVASHPWDLHGARAAGLATGYLSRGLPWPASLDAPDFTAPNLEALARDICAL